MATNSVSPKKGKVVDIPDATITIGTPTAGAGQVSIAFTVATTPATGGPVQKYTAVSNPDSVTVSGSTSPIVVTGLTNDTAYTIQVAAANATGRGLLSAASASATPAAPGDYESIATVTVGSGGVASITFSSIAADWKHLQIRGRYRCNGDPGLNQYPQSDTTAANYYIHYLLGDGVSAVAGAAASNPLIAHNGADSNLSGSFSTFVVDILDYANSNKYKVSRSMNGSDYNGSGLMIMTSHLWKSTTPITSLLYKNFYGLTLVEGTQLALYGIKG